MRCGASQKKPLRDSTRSTALSGLIFWDVPQIAAYREKLNFLSEGVRFVLSQKKRSENST